MSTIAQTAVEAPLALVMKLDDKTVAKSANPREVWGADELAQVNDYTNEFAVSHGLFETTPEHVWRFVGAAADAA